MIHDPPNILMILSDELRADALGCFGNPVVATPAIDRLAREGTRFDQCMVTQPTCTPSRASILSGCYPSTLRSRMVGCYTPDDPRFLPRVLAAHGYRTASIGKLHMVPQSAEPEHLKGVMASGDGSYYGFQEVDLVNGHGDGCFGPRYTPWLLERVPDAAERRKQRRPYPHGVDAFHSFLTPEVHSSRYLAEQTEAFLDSVDERPFFLHLSFADPHYPFTVPEPYASRYDPAAMPPPIPPITESRGMPALHEDVYYRRSTTLSGPGGAPVDRVIGTPPHDYSRYGTTDWQQVKAIYYGMVSILDDGVARVVAALESRGLRDDTVVVFVSDHGDYLGDHGYYGKGLAYDGVLRTPMIFAGPGIRAGRVVPGIASTLDLAPTLLDLAGAEEPEGVQGSSMRELLAGSREAVRSVALVENDDDFIPARMRTVVTAGWKLTYYLDSGEGELIDRANDPMEMTNLWRSPAHEQQRERLLRLLLEETLRSIDLRGGRRQVPAAPVPKYVRRQTG